MAQFRTTADIVDSVLTKCGEVTNGRSAYESRALEYINRIHHSIVSGGNEFNVEVDEPWTWARATHPLILELKPAYTTGTLTLTKGSEVGTLSASPTYSMAGWHLRIDGKSSVYKIASHTAASTSIELDGAYADTSGTLNFKAFQLDYELVPSYIIINDRNNKLDFIEIGTTELTATLTKGSYTPSELATEVKTQLDVAGANTYTVTYNSITKKFRITSDLLTASSIFRPMVATGSNNAVSGWSTLGLDIEDYATAATHNSTYILGGISRLIEPVTTYGGYYNQSKISGIDELRFIEDFPLAQIIQGYPSHYCKIKEYADGTVWLRFNRYVETEIRIEIPYIPVPYDLKDNAASVPLIPRKYIEVLEFGAASDILFEKEDTKWEGYQQKAAAKLNAMMVQNRNQLQRIGDNFGQTIARTDLLPRSRKLIYGIPGEG